MAKDLKNKIINAYENETPDFRERIVSACENETQAPAALPVHSTNAKKQKHPFLFRRIVAVTSCLILFGVGLFIGKIIPESQPIAEAQTCVYIDVNPSLELSLDEDNTVLSCVAANEDAKIILNGMKLEGVELKTALNAIVGSMYVKGYLTSDDNSMLISVDTSDVTHTNGFLTYITQQVNDVFKNSEMECAIIAQGVKVDKDLKRRAEEQGVSVGKMHLLDKMVDCMGDLSQEEIDTLSSLSIKNLNLIYSQSPNGNRPPDELISGSVKVKVTEEQALNAVLSKINKTADDVEEYHVFILPSKRGESKAVYAVTLKLVGDATMYKYEVDCQTGEVATAPPGAPPSVPPNEAPHKGGGFEGIGGNPPNNEFPNDKP